MAGPSMAWRPTHLPPRRRRIDPGVAVIWGALTLLCVLGWGLMIYGAAAALGLLPGCTC